MADRHGTVWYGDRRVGRLREDADRLLRFAYDGDWLAGGGFPISVRLPLSNGEGEVEAHAYFEGLLPEGRVRQRICRRLGIDIDDDTGLLLAIGEDCAGALSILPADAEPSADSGSPESLSDRQLERLVESAGAEADVNTGGRQRFSLAGAQEKQPVIFDGERYSLPDRAHPSSHILKFETVRRVCVAEFLANSMARLLGLPVVETEFLQIGAPREAAPFLRIGRFDRTLDASGTLRRLHQEDMLQALGEPTAFKYQEDGGPSIADVSALLRAHTARPVEALARLRDWQIFNYLSGNWDGHAKNLALTYVPDQSVPALAPFYDLLAIEFLNLVRPGTWSRNMAFAVGGQHQPERVTRTAWEGFARDLGMPPKRVLARIEEFAVRLPETASSARQSFAEAHGDEAVYDRLEESVRRRCRWTLTTVFGGK